jgi:hypothetical protein
MEQSGSAVVMDGRNTAWDYTVLSFHSRQSEALQEKLKEYGRDGWELVFMQVPMPNEYQCVFRKRL